MTDTNAAAPPSSSPDINKALGAGVATTFGGAIAKIIIRILNAKWPGFVDPSIEDSIDTILVGIVGFLGAYYVPHGK